MTTTAVARLDDAAPLAIQPGQELFTGKQRAALAVLGIKDASNADLAVFMHYCQRTELDPFSRQIYYIKRRERVGNDWVDKWTIQVGIDGYRVLRDRVAARTRCTVEFEDTTWYDDDGAEHAVWLSPEPPAACRVVLLKHQDGKTLRYAAVLRTAAYMAMKDGKPVSQWKTQADHMIEKCCEAFSTRRAFPNDFSGLYIPEEMTGGGEAAPEVRRVRAADIIISRQGAEVIADRMGQADVETADDDHADPTAPADATTSRSSQESASDASAASSPEVTAQQVNDQFKRLGFAVKDRKEVLAAAAAIADRKLPLASVAELTSDQLAEVHDRLAACGTRDDVVALLVAIAESRGPDPDGDAAAERAFKAGDTDG
jgi:phage recombination protein Bet